MTTNHDPETAQLAHHWNDREPFALRDPETPERIWLLETPCPYYIEPDNRGTWFLTFRWFDVPLIPEGSTGYPSKEDALAAFSEFAGWVNPPCLPDPDFPRRLWLFAKPIPFSCDLLPCGEWGVAAHTDAESPVAGTFQNPERCAFAFLKSFGRARALSVAGLRGYFRRGLEFLNPAT